MSLEDRLDRLEAAAAAVRELGLREPAAEAEAVLHRVRERAGFPGVAYVLAFAGGTGVGKSSLLNALAGDTVSAVRAVRPTTDEPIAWVADDLRGELDGLLAWLGVAHTAGHADAALANVAILDLPDVDSVRTEHRALVDELLPRIDSIAWVVDPEKYDDERLHAYLRSLVPHAGRMRFVLNKADRLADVDRGALVDDLRRRLAEAGLGAARIHVTSASTGAGVAELRAALSADADAKALIAAKLSADVAEASDTLASAVGIDRDGEHRPLVTDRRREAATAEAVEGALLVVDPPGLARQVRAAVLNRARRSGGSLLGRAVALLGWMTGQHRRSADPAGYLRDWRRRGSLGRVVNPVHALLVEASEGVPAASRPAILRAAGAEEMEAAVTRALDRVAREAGDDLRVPGSLLWPLIGVVQLAVGAVFILAVAWYVTLFLAGGGVPVATVDLALLGPVPLPLVLLAGSVIVSGALGLILSLHAGWIGGRVGRRVAARVHEAVSTATEEAGLLGLARVESVRRSLADGRDD